jgi:uncharacterized protein (TIGR02172 family)
MQDLGKPVAVGRTSEVFPWDNDRVLKLGYPSSPSCWIEDEFGIGKYVQEMGLPVPRIYERVRINDRDGIVFERIEGPSLLAKLIKKPWKVNQYAQMMAKLHAKIHEVPAPVHIGTQREWVREEIIDANEFLKGELQYKVFALLDSLPDGNTLCHGDFHPGNIVMTKQGPVIIDWMTVSRGSAMGDVAITSLALKVGKAPVSAIAQRILNIIGNTFHSTYLKAYFQIHPGQRQLIRAWRIVMAASHLDVSEPEDRANLLNIIYAGLDSCGS